MNHSLEVANQAFNNSPSKSTYSFPKSKRFEDVKLPYLHPKYYEPKDVKDHRSAIIGYGHKWPINKVSISPPPSHYSIKIGFDQKRKSEGAAFGLSRDQIKKVVSYAGYIRRRS